MVLAAWDAAGRGKVWRRIAWCGSASHRMDGSDRAGEGRTAPSMHSIAMFLSPFPRQGVEPDFGDHVKPLDVGQIVQQRRVGQGCLDRDPVVIAHRVKLIVVRSHGVWLASPASAATLRRLPTSPIRRWRRPSGPAFRTSRGF